jgi:hypothetical protein
LIIKKKLGNFADSTSLTSKQYINIHRDIYVFIMTTKLRQNSFVSISHHYKVEQKTSFCSFFEIFANYISAKIKPQVNIVRHMSNSSN